MHNGTSALAGNRSGVASAVPAVMAALLHAPLLTDQKTRADVTPCGSCATADTVTGSFAAGTMG
jgi:hypothetical protein